MKSKEFKQGMPETGPTKNEAEEESLSPNNISELPQDKEYIETQKEKEITDRKIEEVLTWLEKEEPMESQFLKVVQEYKNARAEKEKGTFCMLRELWSVTPSDCKVALLGEFIFNPNALKARYFEEMNFQRNTKSRWNRMRQ